MTIEDVWNSPLNAPLPSERDALVMRTRDQLRRIQRRRVTFILCTAISLTAVTAVSAYVWTTRRGDIAGAWPLHLLLLAQWSVLALFVREALAARHPVHEGASIRESLERLWREAENQRRGQMVVLALFALAAPLLGAAIIQLGAMGKMAPHEATSAATLFGGILATSTAVILVRRHLVVLPRHRQLSTLLQQYRSSLAD